MDYFLKKFLLALCLSVSIQPTYCWSWRSIISSASSFLAQIERKTAAGIGVIFGIVVLTGYAYKKNFFNKNKKSNQETTKTNDAQNQKEKEILDDIVIQNQVDSSLAVQEGELVNRNTFFQNVILFSNLTKNRD